MNRAAFMRSKLLLLACAAVVIAAATAAMYLHFAAKLEAHMDKWRHDGFAAAAAGEHAKAVENLEPYLRRRPSDADALWCYIGSRRQAEMPRRAHLLQAAQALKQFIVLRPDRRDASQDLLDLYLAIDRRTEAIDLANTMIVRWGDDPRILAAKVDAHSRLRQYDDALAAADRWCKVAPLDTTAHATRLVLRTRLGHPAAEIVADAKALHEAHPKDARFELLQGIAYALTGDTEQATAWVRRAAAGVSPNDDFADLVVGQLDGLGLYDDSLALLRKVSGARAERGVRLALRLWDANRPAEVLEQMRAIDIKSPTMDATTLAIAALAAQQVGDASARASYRQELSARSGAVALAWSSILESMSKPTILDGGRLAADCRAALTQDPTNAYLAYFLGEAMAQQGELDLAVEMWKQAAAKRPAWSLPLARTADALLARGQAQLAVAAASAAFARDRASVVAAVVLARALFVAGELSGSPQTTDLLSFVSDIQQKAPGEESTLAIYIRLLERAGQKDQAAALLQSALERKPPLTMAVLLQLASASEASGLGLDDACLAAAEKTYGMTPELAFARISNAAAKGQAVDPLRSFDAASTSSASSDAKAWTLARARLLDLIADPSAAAAWQSLMERYRDDLDVQRSALLAPSLRGNPDVMRRAIERVRSLGGEQSLQWRLAEARLLASSADEAERGKAAKSLHDILRVSPSLMEARVLLADLLQTMGKPDDAIKEYRAAAALEPESVALALHLAELLQARGQPDAARLELDRVADRLRSPAQRRQAALVLAREGDWDRVAHLLEQDRSTTAAGADLLLVRAYMNGGDPAKAEALLRKLLEKPDLLTIQTAIDFYLTQERPEDAAKAVGLLERVPIDRGTRELVLGNYHARIGKSVEAAQHFRAASTQPATIAAAWKALMVTQCSVGATGEFAATIRDATRAAPGDADLTTISAQVDLLTAAAAEPSLAPLALAFLKAPADGSAALESLKVLVPALVSGDAGTLPAKLRQLADRFPEFMPVHLLLARSLAAVGRTNEAAAIAEETSRAFPRADEPTDMWFSILASAGRWQEALGAADAWRRRTRASARAADVAAASALCALGRYPVALDRLAPYAAAADARPNELAIVLITRAQALSLSGDDGKARESLWPLAKSDAKWRSMWIRLAAETLKPADAAGWLEQAAAVVPTDSPAANAELAEGWQRLGVRSRDEQFIARATKLFESLVRGDTVPVQVLVAAAAQREACNDAPGAEVLYRRALATSPQSPPLQNNLAMTLASQGKELPEARQLAAAAAAAMPRSATVCDTLAFVQFKSGNLTDAVAQVRRAVQLEPANAKWQIRLAHYLMAAGAGDEAAKLVDSIRAEPSFNLGALPEPLKREWEQLCASRDGGRASTQ